MAKAKAKKMTKTDVAAVITESSEAVALMAQELISEAPAELVLIEYRMEGKKVVT